MLTLIYGLDEQYHITVNLVWEVFDQRYMYEKQLALIINFAKFDFDSDLGEHLKFISISKNTELYINSIDSLYSWNYILRI